MVSSINEAITRFYIRMKDESGQALAEYGLILALIAVVCIVALGLIGTNLAAKLDTIATKLA